MAAQLSTAVRNAKLDAIETTIGTSPILRVYTGSAPANCAAAATGTLLAEMTLPSDWMAAASGGQKALSGTWEDLSANATDTAGYWRIWDSGGTVCGMQGTATATGGGGDIEFNTVSFVTGASVTITAFTWTEGNA